MTNVDRDTGQLLMMSIILGAEMIMADYKKMYSVLCRAADAAITKLERSPLSAQSAAQTLRIALQKAEDIFIETADESEDN